MKRALIVCAVLVIIFSHGFAEEKSSYPIASPLANFKWRIYNPLSVSTRHAIITQFIANSSLVVIPEKIHKILPLDNDKWIFLNCGKK